ncbi:MAG TPA: hypothetical protein VM840_10000 [Actinomycetota bacterium]|nr:hypothetical protein [Actinomycetota bacterium]
MEGTGRAEIRFSTGKEEWVRRGTARVAFAGQNLEMEIDFAPDGRSPGFRARNRTVDGEFYLLDGIPGQEGWFHDVNAAGAQRSDLFNIDPRSVLTLLEPTVGFEEVGRDEIDGQPVRHLRATRTDQAPPLNFGMGSTEGQDMKQLDVWIDEENIVRRIDVRFSTTLASPSAGEILVKDENGDTRKIPTGEDSLEPKTVTTHSSYSARFYDLGAAIEIVAPVDVTRVEGKG